MDSTSNYTRVTANVKQVTARTWQLEGDAVKKQSQTNNSSWLGIRLLIEVVPRSGSGVLVVFVLDCWANEERHETNFTTLNHGEVCFAFDLSYGPAPLILIMDT